jgi:hypothetical protein
MHLQKEINTNLKITDEKSRNWSRTPHPLLKGSGSVTKCYGSGTIVFKFVFSQFYHDMLSRLVKLKNLSDRLAADRQQTAGEKHAEVMRQASKQASGRQQEGGRHSAGRL